MEKPWKYLALATTLVAAVLLYEHFSRDNTDSKLKKLYSSSADTTRVRCDALKKNMTLRILICATGSIAVIKVKEIDLAFKRLGESWGIFLEIRWIFTQAAWDLLIEKPSSKFYSPNAESEENDTILHVELGNWADVIIVAPATANTIGKLINGISDNFVTTVLRVVDPMKKPVLIYPAMNTAMWYSKVTQHNVMRLKKLCYYVANPIVKKLACGVVGIGALPEPEMVARSAIYVSIKYYEIILSASLSSHGKVSPCEVGCRFESGSYR